MATIQASGLGEGTAATNPAASEHFKDHERDEPGAGTLRVLVIAVVVVVHAPPEVAALGLLDHPGAHGAETSVELGPDRVGMSAEVVIPGWVMIGTGLGRHNNEAAVVRGI